MPGYQGMYFTCDNYENKYKEKNSINIEDQKTLAQN